MNPDCNWKEYSDWFLVRCHNQQANYLEIDVLPNYCHDRHAMECYCDVFENPTLCEKGECYSNAVGFLQIILQSDDKDLYWKQGMQT